MKTVGIVVIVFLLLCVIFGPLLIVWALNGLFPLEVAYGFRSWASVVILLAVIAALLEGTK